MIELTDDQIRLLHTAATPPRVRNPQTQETFVLLRIAEYERLTAPEYDDRPWTRDELEAVAWEAGKAIGWEDMDEYDQLPEKPGTEAR
jgi:hypothetical protein